jgi:hypothetical protein
MDDRRFHLHELSRSGDVDAIICATWVGAVSRAGDASAAARAAILVRSGVLAAALPATIALPVR